MGEIRDCIRTRSNPTNRTGHFPAGLDRHPCASCSRQVSRCHPTGATTLPNRRSTISDTSTQPSASIESCSPSRRSTASTTRRSSTAWRRSTPTHQIGPRGSSHATCRSPTGAVDLDASGVRGVRLNTDNLGGMPISFEEIPELCARIARLGWHIEFLFPGRHDRLMPVFTSLTVPMSIGHFAYQEAVDGVEAPGFRRCST